MKNRKIETVDSEGVQPSSKAKSREKMVEKLNAALLEIVARGDKVSISAVAKYVKVTPALLHNTYPEVAEKIRVAMNKSTRVQRVAKQVLLAKEREANRALRDEVATLRRDMARLASNNQVLINKIALLDGLASGKVISLIQSNK